MFQFLTVNTFTELCKIVVIVKAFAVSLLSSHLPSASFSL